MSGKTMFLILLTGVFATYTAIAQSLEGSVIDEDGNPLPGANIKITGTTLGTASKPDGSFSIDQAPEGEHEVQVSVLGYKPQRKRLQFRRGKRHAMKVQLEEAPVNMAEVVVTGGRREQLYTDTPVKINVIDQSTFDAVQSVSLLEGLSFQPGLRIENNCQNCGFTQVRINGLEGPYTQVLLDSRPVFSSLAGVYGLEFIPSVMIDRVEVLRGGGSSLYGANAIAGTINVITKDPFSNSVELSTSSTFLGEGVTDNSMQLGTSLVNSEGNMGAYLYGVYRSRNPYDHDGDGYSEIASLDNTSLGVRAYYKPGIMSKVTADFRTINEERRGGNRFEFPMHEADIAEGTTHHVLMGNVSYEQFLPGGIGRFALYGSTTVIARDSYYGAGRDPNAYGTTESDVALAGGQYSHILKSFLGGEGIISAGAEYTVDRLEDRAPGYNRFIDQSINTYGVYVQHEQEWSELVTLIVGARYDNHSLLEDAMLNPRANIMIKPFKDFSMRLSYSTGFRPPQTFDEDLHIEAVGGNVLLIQNMDGLLPEKSTSYCASADYAIPLLGSQLLVTLDGFYTDLENVFVLEETASTDGNLLMERRNGAGGQVAGGGFELRYAFGRDFSLQGGMTFQESRLAAAAEWSEGKFTTEMLRTPSAYGFITALVTLSEPLSVAVSAVYTGSMTVPHYAGYIEEDVLEKTDPFFDATMKVTYELLENPGLEVFAGVYNILDMYQSDFDQGPNRDAGYMYGPIRPRSFFAGLNIGM